MPRIDYGGGLTIDAPAGMTILEASLQHGLDHRAACGGVARCTTCRVEILEGIENCPAMSEVEQEVLALGVFEPHVRLGCSVHPTGDVKIRLLVREHIDKKDLRPEGMGREREIAVLFADIRNFTSFSESHMAFDVLHLLNRYFDRMGTIIDFNHGDVIAFIGDGIVCFFEDTDAKRAAVSGIRCALQMLKAASAFSRYSSDHFGFAVQTGIGIAWGSAVIGEVGYYRNTRLNCIGDVVNTASRVQDATKEYGVPFLITQPVRELVESEFEFGSEFHCELRGKAGEHALYEVLGERRKKRRRTPS